VCGSARFLRRQISDPARKKPVSEAFFTKDSSLFRRGFALPHRGERQLGENLSLDICKQPGVIYSQAMQDRRVEVVQVHRVARDIIAVIICLADAHACT
jgi:hypothetical protein